MGGEEDVFVLLEVQPFEYGAFLYSLPGGVQDLLHGGPGDEDMLLPETL